MKRFLTLMVCLVAIATAYGQDNYYWYYQEQIPLTSDYSQYFIVYDNLSVKEIIADKDNAKDVVNSGDLTINATIEKLTVNSEIYKNWNWALISKTLKESIEKNYNLIYTANSYKKEDGTLLGLSNIFYVKLKNEDDASILKKEAEKYGVDIIGYNSYAPLWYELMCTNNENGNALVLSNIFKETNLFAASEPNLMSSNDLNDMLPALYREKDDSKYYIFHYSKDLYDLLQTEAYSKNVLSNGEVGTVGCVYRDGMEQKLQGSYFATINSVILDEILQKYDVPYYSPYYKFEQHTRPVSNFFYVKLKSEDDVALLEQQAEQLHVEIVGNNEHMPLWYTLICFDNKSGTSIECGNKIYESGIFQAVDYDVMEGITRLSVLPTVNQSLIIKKKSSDVIEVSLNNSSTYKNIQLSIYSPSGLLVKQFNYENESSFSKEINLSDLKSNVYICVINADGQKTTKTFVK